jgi:hypothetical protein
MNMETAILKRSLQVKWSGIRIMFGLADEIPGVINLGIGQLDFDTPEFIREAAGILSNTWPRSIGWLLCREAFLARTVRLSASFLRRQPGNTGGRNFPHQEGNRESETTSNFQRRGHSGLKEVRR